MTPTPSWSTLGAVADEHGRIDILVNDAGVDLMLPVPGGDLRTVRQVFDVNFFSTVAGTLAVVPGMIERGWGVVVNVSSDTARRTRAEARGVCRLQGGHLGLQ